MSLQGIMQEGLGGKKEMKTLEERETMMKEITKVLKMVYIGHIVDSGVSYFEVEASSYVGRIYEPDVDVLYSYFKGIYPANDMSLEQREKNLAHEFERAGIFLAGKIKIKLPLEANK